MANLQAPEYKVENGKLVLAGTKPLDSDFAQKIADNITLMVNSLIDPLTRLGEMEGMLFSGPIGKGIDLLGSLGNSLSQFALGVSAMAELQVPEYKVENGKLVLVGTKPLDANFAQKVATNIDMIVSSLIDPIKKLGENSGFFFDSDFEDGLELLGQIGGPIKDLGDGILAFSQLDASSLNTEMIGSSIQTIAGSITKSFGKSSGYTEQSNVLFGGFTEHFSKFTSSVSSFKETKIAEVLMKTKESINGLDIKKLSKLNDLVFNFKNFAEEIKDSFKDVAEILDKVIDMIETLNGSSINVRSNVSTGSSSSSSNISFPDEITVSNIDEVTEALETVADLLSGTINVRTSNSLIN